jgi:hypothetical protein
MNRARRAEAELVRIRAALVLLMADNRTDEQRMLGYPAISNTVEK